MKMIFSKNLKNKKGFCLDFTKEVFLFVLACTKDFCSFFVKKTNSHVKTM